MLTRPKSIISFSVLLIATLLSMSFADSGPEHQIYQDRPIKLGTSGGNINDRSSMYCCSGTLGALVQAGDMKFILSNNHVLARTNLASVGDPVNQPGQIDQNCGQQGHVANLTDFVTIRFKKGRSAPINKIDAAIALVVDGTVDPNGAIIDIGRLSSETAAAQLGQAVKKSGRTTGLTSGTVTDIGVTVDVAYSKSCGGGGTQVARFNNQIIITSSDGPFSAGGDSGSLIVEDQAVQPRAVGLLFAGSSSYTIANPIDAVLNAFGVSMAGGTVTSPPPPPPASVGTISGVVTEKGSTTGISGATVEADSGQSAQTDGAGVYTIENVPVGERSARASASGFRSQTKSVTVSDGAVAVANFALRVSKGKGNSRSSNVRAALNAKKRNETKLFEIDGVVGIGVGLSKNGEPVIRVYMEKDLPETRRAIPHTIEGIAVESIVTGVFEAF